MSQNQYNGLFLYKKRYNCLETTDCIIQNWWPEKRNQETNTSSVLYSLSAINYE